MYDEVVSQLMQTPLCGGAGNRTLVQRDRLEASPGAVVLVAYSAFPLLYDPTGKAA